MMINHIRKDLRKSYLLIYLISWTIKMI